MAACEIPKAFHVITKPVGSACNLLCDYCFYLKKAKLYPGSDFRMSPQVHEAYIRQLLEFHQGPQVTVAWQGGEPTLMGLDFFMHSVHLQKKHQKPNTYIENTFQTNGILLNDEWCRFFRKNNFLVGRLELKRFYEHPTRSGLWVKTRDAMLPLDQPPVSLSKFRERPMPIKGATV